MTLNLANYRLSDLFFGRPYLDVDVQRDEPCPHRYLHGGFEGTDTRFFACFPEHDVWRGRFVQPLEGALGGNEHAFHDDENIARARRLGAYLVGSNQGHVGVARCPAAGDDSSIYGYRASAEAARFSGWLAHQIYGSPPTHGYVYGPSGGARRSILCLENVDDVWDGAFPYMMAGPVGGAPAGRAQRTQVGMYSAMFNVQRLLGGALAGVVDACDPGGSGDPFRGLTTRQREALETLYRMGFPRGSELMIGAPAGQVMLWYTEADNMRRQDPAYFGSFWSEPGHVGHDDPAAIAGDLIDKEIRKVAAVVTAGEVVAELGRRGPEAEGFTPLAQYAARLDPQQPIGMIPDRPLGGHVLGASLRVASGEAAGRALYCSGAAGEALLAGGSGPAGNALFEGVVVGDQVLFDNRDFLAFCYHHRHHVIDAATVFDHLRVDGHHVYPQAQAFYVSPLAGPAYTARFDGRMLLQQHTHDTSCWPSEAVAYAAAVEQSGAGDGFRLRWVENAEHGHAPFLPRLPGRSEASGTRFVDYRGMVEQGLRDLIAWVEDGIDPGSIRHHFADGLVSLPTNAAERGGIQPVIRLTAAGENRVIVPPGDAVVLEVTAEVPPGKGTVVAVEWDPEGSGQWVSDDRVDGTQGSVSLVREYAYADAGIRFPCVRVVAHRDGDGDDASRRIENLARARVVVRRAGTSEVRGREAAWGSPGVPPA